MLFIEKMYENIFEMYVYSQDIIHWGSILVQSTRNLILSVLAIRK